MVRKPPKRHQQEEPEVLEDDEDVIDADGHNNNIVYRGDSEDPNPHQQSNRPDPNPEETEVNIVYKGDSKDPNPHQQPSRPDPNPKRPRLTSSIEEIPKTQTHINNPADPIQTKETEVNIVYR